MITRVCRRNEEKTDTARAFMQWSNDVARDLLPVSSGIDSADVGPDPRDAVLATEAFGAKRQYDHKTRTPGSLDDRT